VPIHKFAETNPKQKSIPNH